MIPSRIDTHESDASALLTERFRGKLVTDGLLRVLASRTQALEAVVWDTLFGRLLNNAVGAHLDDLGAFVLVGREGRSDDDYRGVIKLRIRVNRSMGGSIDMTEVAAMIYPAATYVECFPAAWEVSMYEITNAADAIVLLGQTKAAGTYGCLLTTTRPAARVFKFDYSATPIAGDVFDSAAVGATIDKTFPAALPTSPGYVRARS